MRRSEREQRLVVIILSRSAGQDDKKDGNLRLSSREKIAAQVSESRGRIATHEELHDGLRRWLRVFFFVAGEAVS
jgi:hypothetical protein